MATQEKQKTSNTAEDNRTQPTRFLHRFLQISVNLFLPSRMWQLGTLFHRAITNGGQQDFLPQSCLPKNGNKVRCTAFLHKQLLQISDTEDYPDAVYLPFVTLLQASEALPTAKARPAWFPPATLASHQLRPQSLESRPVFPAFRVTITWHKAEPHCSTGRRPGAPSPPLTCFKAECGTQAAADHLVQTAAYASASGMNL